MEVKTNCENTLEWAENLYWQGLIALDQHHYEEAGCAFSKAIALDPLLSKCLYWRGVVFCQQGKYDSAASDFIDCLCVEPTMADAYLWLALSQKRGGKSDAAFMNFARYIACLRQSE